MTTPLLDSGRVTETVVPALLHGGRGGPLRIEMLCSEDLRGPFYIVTVWAMVVIEFFLLFSQIGSPYIFLYLLAFIPVVAGTCLTAGWGVAEYWQARYDERKFRKQIERELIG